MADNLVIVESPAKAKTIKKYLGRDFDVLASYGHVRDLVPKEGAVDPGQRLRHEVPGAREERAPRRGHLRAPAQVQGAVPGHRPGPRGRGDRLAPEGDPRLRAAISTARTCTAWCSTRSRATPSAQRSQQPRGLSLELVNAQQARRALDYLVGFNLSPLLWKKVRRGLSAGRVQSPALRMICEREEEIAAFMAQEYWTIEGEGAHSGQAFPLKLLEYRGEKVEQFSFTNETAAREVETHASRAAAGGAGGARARCGCWRSIASSAAAIRRRPSRPRRCSRRPRASSASTRAAPCASRSSCTRARTSARAASASSPTCAPTRCRWRPRR